QDDSIEQKRFENAQGLKQLASAIRNHFEVLDHATLIKVKNAVSVIRSKQMLSYARKHGLTHLVLGAYHAHDMKEMDPGIVLHRLYQMKKKIGGNALTISVRIKPWQINCWKWHSGSARMQAEVEERFGDESGHKTVKGIKYPPPFHSVARRGKTGFKSDSLATKKWVRNPPKYASSGGRTKGV
ncbi:MAG TPA: hypothetical protein VI874_03380, partial [Candidatus Norongarragalinales archaeon]|nr:hypothetical protein [Candidatus Norongarragalinales archaeon]